MALRAQSARPHEMRAPIPLTRSVSLRSRVTILSATVVLVSVSLMAAAAYFTVHRAMYNDIDKQLESRADGLTAMASVGLLDQQPEVLLQGTVFSTSISVMVVSPSGLALRIGDVPMGNRENAIMASPGSARAMQSVRTIEGKRVLARKLSNGYTVILAEGLLHTDRVLKRLAWVLLVVGGGGVAFAALAGTAV
ncbi:MAG: two-component sensor histidine kinase, partial [Gordonia amarae]